VLNIYIIVYIVTTFIPIIHF